jgi:hypothetical protein
LCDLILIGRLCWKLPGFPCTPHKMQVSPGSIEEALNKMISRGLVQIFPDGH